MAARNGTNPIAWSIDDLLALGGATPLDVCLAEARQAGYAGIELGNKFPRTASALRPILERHGLALVSGWHGAGLLSNDAATEWDLIGPHLDLLQAMGCRAVVFAEVTGTVHPRQSVPLARRPIPSVDDIRRLGGRMTALAERVQGRGLAIAYHPHMGTVIQTDAEIDALMAATGPAVGLLLDTGHIAFAGGDPLAVARRHAGRIVHVHTKDLRAAVARAALDRDGSFLDAVVDGAFTVPGDGSIDFAPILAVLAAAGYDGWLVVEAEQDPAKANPLAYATTGFRHLDALARAAGLV